MQVVAVTYQALSRHFCRSRFPAIFCLHSPGLHTFTWLAHVDELTKLLIGLVLVPQPCYARPTNLQPTFNACQCLSRCVVVSPRVWFCLSLSALSFPGSLGCCRRCTLVVVGPQTTRSSSRPCSTQQQDCARRSSNTSRQRCQQHSSTQRVCVCVCRSYV